MSQGLKVTWETPGASWSLSLSDSPVCHLGGGVPAWDILMEEEGSRGLSKQVAILLACEEEGIETVLPQGIHLTVHRWCVSFRHGWIQEPDNSHQSLSFSPWRRPASGSCSCASGWHLQAGIPQLSVPDQMQGLVPKPTACQSFQSDVLGAIMCPCLELEVRSAWLGWGSPLEILGLFLKTGWMLGRAPDVSQGAQFHVLCPPRPSYMDFLSRRLSMPDFSASPSPGDTESKKVAEAGLA